MPGVPAGDDPGSPPRDPPTTSSDGTSVPPRHAPTAPRATSRRPQAPSGAAGHPVGVLAAGVALALLDMIGFVTNLALLPTSRRALVSPSANHPGVLAM